MAYQAAPAPTPCCIGGWAWGLTDVTIRASPRHASLGDARMLMYLPSPCLSSFLNFPLAVTISYLNKILMQMKFAFCSFNPSFVIFFPFNPNPTHC